MPEERKALAVSAGAEVVHFGSGPVSQLCWLSQDLASLLVDWRHPEVEVLGGRLPQRLKQASAGQPIKVPLRHGGKYGHRRTALQIAALNRRGEVIAILSGENISQPAAIR